MYGLLVFGLLWVRYLWLLGITPVCLRLALKVNFSNLLFVLRRMQVELGDRSTFK